MATQMDLFERYETFEPDYTHDCKVCGITPVVTTTLQGVVTSAIGLCGVCAFGDVDSNLDPENWNKECE